MRSARIAIVGAGPAGLAAALAARHAGLEVTVFEKALDFHRGYDGVVLQSNGLRALAVLGVLDALQPLIRCSPQFTLELVTGQRLLTFEYGHLPGRYPFAAVVQRRQLQEYLLSAAEWHDVSIHFGHRCTGLTMRQGEVCLRFANGTQHRCDVVIGSDGSFSQVRESVGLPAMQRSPRGAYLRGIANRPTAHSTIREIWGMDGRRFMICPLPDGQTAFSCSVPFDGWRAILKAQVEDWIDSWHSYGVEVLALLRAVEDWQQVSYNELHQVELRTWSQPPVFLLGDAAHAMLPWLNQSVNSALVDALVLMELLAPALHSGGDLQAVGRTYEQVRRSIVSQTQRMARRWHTMSAWSSFPARLSRDTVLKYWHGLGWTSRRMLLLAAGYNAREERFFHEKGDHDQIVHGC